MNSIPVVGLDRGFRYTKVTDGRYTYKFPSVIGEYRERIRLNLGGAYDVTENLEVEVDGEKFLVGALAQRQSAIRQNPLDDDHISGIPTKVLAKTALALFGYPEMRVVTGLPNDHMHLREKFEAMLLGAHNVVINGKLRQFRVVEARCCPQPLGTFGYLILDDVGKIRDVEVASQHVGIIDIGGRTTDPLQVKECEPIDQYSPTWDIGVNSICELLRERLYREFQVTLDRTELDDYLKTKEITIYGRQRDISALIADACKHVADKLAQDLSGLWKNAWQLDTVVITGGGASLLGPRLLERFPNSRMIPSEVAVVSNVIGYYRLGRFWWSMSA